MKTGLAHDPADDKIMPSQSQLALGPGDYVVITHQGSGADNEFMIARVVNPEEHAATFPDWEERLLGSFLLVLWRSPSQTEGTYGWVPRARLVQVTLAQYTEMLDWMNGNEPEEIPPRWMVLTYGDAIAEMAEANPETATMPIRCPACDSYAVTIELVQTKTQLMVMGFQPEDRGKTIEEAGRLYEASNYRTDSESVTTLHCWACEYTEELPQEIMLYD